MNSLHLRWNSLPLIKFHGPHHLQGIFATPTTNSSPLKSVPKPNRKPDRPTPTIHFARGFYSLAVLNFGMVLPPNFPKLTPTNSFKKFPNIKSQYILSRVPSSTRGMWVVAQPFRSSALSKRLKVERHEVLAAALV